MNLNSENKQAVHEVLISDMQKRLFKQYNEAIAFHEQNKHTDEDYTSILETLVENILHTSSIRDICEMLHKYDTLFPSEYLTIDGTLNYVLQLLCSKITAHENDLRKYSV